MNKIVMLISAMIISLSAYAGNEGAQATPSMPTNVIAEYSTYGGLFVPPGYPSGYSYQILTDKTVVETVYFHGGSPKVRVIARLNPQQYARIVTLVNQVIPGDIFDPNPSSPGCQDAGGSSYRVFGRNGEIKIAEQHSCKTMKRENTTHADLKIIAILNSYVPKRM